MTDKTKTNKSTEVNKTRSMKYQQQWMRKVLVYLYEYFKHDNAKIIQEFCNRELSKKGLVKITNINKYFKEHNIKMSNYVTMLDNGFIGNQDPIHPVLVYLKSNPPKVNEAEAQEETDTYTDSIDDLAELNKIIENTN